MSGRKKLPVGTSVSPDEMRELEQAAAAEGVTVSTLVYRRVMNKPDAVRRTGRPPKHSRTQPEGLFQMTG